VGSPCLVVDGYHPERSIRIGTAFADHVIVFTLGAEREEHAPHGGGCQRDRCGTRRAPVQRGLVPERPNGHAMCTWRCTTPFIMRNSRTHDTCMLDGKERWGRRPVNLIQGWPLPTDLFIDLGSATVETDAQARGRSVGVSYDVEPVSRSSMRRGLDEREAR
jgi:hypothetical protein